MNRNALAAEILKINGVLLLVDSSLFRQLGMVLRACLT